MGRRSESAGRRKMTMSDADVVRDVLSGRHDSFSTLVERHFTSIYGLCVSYVKDATEAEDAAQDTFVTCYNRLDTLRDPRKFAGWLASIARNICLNRLKAHARRREILTEVAENGMEQEHVVEAERAELREMVRRKVDELPPKTREAVYLYYFEEKSLKEIAAYVGKSPNAVARLLKYGRRLLKDKLWDEAADSIRDMRPKEKSVVAACAAIPLGKAPWCATGGVAAAAAGAGTIAELGGVLTMSTKPVVSTIAVVAVVLSGLFVWSPWANEQSAGPEDIDLISRAGLLALESLEPQTESVPAASETPEDEEQSAGTEEARGGDQVQPPEEMEEPLEEDAAEYASVSGRVINDEGYPFEGANIRLEIISDEFGHNIMAAYGTITGGEGTYEIAGIETFGDAFAYASAQGHVMQKARGLNVSPGIRLDGVDFTLPKGAHFVAGRVVSESRDPIPGASVNLRYYGYSEQSIAGTAETGATGGTITSQANFVFATTNDDGHFEVAVPDEGLCDFTVKKEGYGTGFFAQVPTGTDNALFVLRSYGAITGAVTRADGSPVEGIEVEVTGEAFPGGLTPTRSAIQAFSILPRTAVTDQNGSYEANDLGEDYFYTLTVRDPAAGEVEEPGDTEALGSIEHIARLMYEEESGYEPGALTKRGVRVVAGQTTSGVDFILGATDAAAIYGRVTDTTSGMPVYPLEVSAQPANPNSPFSAYQGGAMSTDSDGFYRITLNIDRPYQFRVMWRYINNGGGEAPREDAEVVVLELGPGDEEEINFTVDAPITVPMLFVDKNTQPLDSIGAGVCRAGSGGGWGSLLVSGLDGRVTYYGMSPGRMYQAVGRKNDRVIGKSEPFSGQPGETVPEVQVVCLNSGGIEGQIVYPDGQPAVNETIMCVALTGDSPEMSGDTDIAEADGAFCILQALPEGTYPKIILLCQPQGDEQPEEVLMATLENVEIIADGVTNVGTIALESVPVETAMEMVQQK